VETGPDIDDQRVTSVVRTLAADVREIKSVLREHRERIGRCLTLLDRIAADQETVIDVLSALIDDQEVPSQSGSDSSADR
jgi:hypothetical protein